MKLMFAYVDPGLGLLAWQAVVAAFFGLLFYLKRTRTWLVRCWRRLREALRQPKPVPATVPQPRRPARR